MVNYINSPNGYDHYRLIGVLHGSKSNCNANPVTSPAIFTNLEHYENFQFIEKWKSLDELFDMRNQNDIIDLLDTLSNVNPTDKNGQYLSDVYNGSSATTREIHNEIISRFCFNHMYDVYDDSSP